MMRVELETPLGRVEVELASDAADAVAPLSYRGAEAAVHLVRRWLEEEAGAFGSRLGSETTPVDLDLALRSPRLRLLRPRVLAGAALAQRYGKPRAGAVR